MAESTVEPLGVTLDDVYRAREVIRPHLHLTPTLTATAIGERAGVHLYLKAECLQKTGSFKPRGGLNRVAALAPEERARGLITISAGNHGQGLAFAARAFGARCTIVVPTTAVQSKVEAMRGYGAEVIQVPSAELFARMQAIQQERGMHFVHPFADPYLVAGYGTIALELIEAIGDFDALIIPTGGGGLLSGLSLAMKELRPGVRVVGVEPELAPGVHRSLREGHAVQMAPSATIADGLAPPFTDEFNLRLIRRYVDDVILVSEDEIAAALRLTLARAKLLAEPSVAGLLSGRAGLQPDSRVVCLLSGGNIDLARLKVLL